MIVNDQLRQNITIVTTFLLGVVLSIVPVPAWAVLLRPEWVWVILIFWLTYLPQKIGPGIAWCIGLYMDLLMGTVLGEHALLFVIIAYVIQRFLSFVRAMPFWQKLLSVGLVTGISLFIQGVFLQWMGVIDFHWTFLLPALSTLFVWPFLYRLCRRPRASYNYRLTIYH